MGRSRGRGDGDEGNDGGRRGQMRNRENKVDRKRCPDSGSALVRLRRALAETSVALKFEMVF